MSRKIATTLAAVAVTCSIGALAAPTASAATTNAPGRTDAVGSVALCLNIPLWPSSLSVSVCI
ncbi:hypothetical protein FOS14_13295 [Skermania sp. ID1734]|nr:hypothetical protein FOS14_13295 [Skermania sp. ID1734]